MLASSKQSAPAPFLLPVTAAYLFGFYCCAHVHLPGSPSDGSSVRVWPAARILAFALSTAAASSGPQAETVTGVEYSEGDPSVAFSHSVVVNVTVTAQVLPCDTPEPRGVLRQVASCSARIFCWPSGAPADAPEHQSQWLSRELCQAGPLNPQPRLTFCCSSLIAPLA